MRKSNLKQSESNLTDHGNEPEPAYGDGLSHTKNMRKNVKISVGVSQDWITPKTPKSNAQNLNLPNLGQSFEPNSSSTGREVPKIGIESLGLTP